MIAFQLNSVQIFDAPRGENKTMEKSATPPITKHEAGANTTSKGEEVEQYEQGE